MIVQSVNSESAVRNRDRTARIMARWYDRDGALAYSVALAALGDRARAETVVRESFLALWRGVAKKSGEGLPKQSALLRLVIDHCLHQSVQVSPVP